MMSLLLLPDEILEEIILYVPVRSGFRFANTCRRVHDLLEAIADPSSRFHRWLRDGESFLEFCDGTYAATSSSGEQTSRHSDRFVLRLTRSPRPSMRIGVVLRVPSRCEVGRPPKPTAEMGYGGFRGFVGQLLGPLFGPVGRIGDVTLILRGEVSVDLVDLTDAAVEVLMVPTWGFHWIEDSIDHGQLSGIREVECDERMSLTFGIRIESVRRHGHGQHRTCCAPLSLSLRISADELGQRFPDLRPFVQGQLFLRELQAPSHVQVTPQNAVLAFERADRLLFSSVLVGEVENRVREAIAASEGEMESSMTPTLENALRDDSVPSGSGVDEDTKEVRCLWGLLEEPVQEGEYDHLDVRVVGIDPIEMECVGASREIISIRQDVSVRSPDVGSAVVLRGLSWSDSPVLCWMRSAKDQPKRLVMCSCSVDASLGTVSHIEFPDLDLPAACELVSGGKPAIVDGSENVFLLAYTTSPDRDPIVRFGIPKDRRFDEEVKPTYQHYRRGDLSVRARMAVALGSADAIAAATQNSMFVWDVSRERVPVEVPSIPWICGIVHLPSLGEKVFLCHSKNEWNVRDLRAAQEIARGDFVDLNGTKLTLTSFNAYDNKYLVGVGSEAFCWDFRALEFNTPVIDPFVLTPTASETVGYFHRVRYGGAHLEKWTFFSSIVQKGRQPVFYCTWTLGGRVLAVINSGRRLARDWRTGRGPRTSRLNVPDQVFVDFE